jgi:uncharacterized protein
MKTKKLLASESHGVRRRDFLGIGLSGAVALTGIAGNVFAEGIKKKDVKKETKVNTNHEKIDIFAHCWPRKYKEAVFKAATTTTGRGSSPKDMEQMKAWLDNTPTLWDIDKRLQLMDKYEGLRHIIDTGNPALEGMIPDKQKAADLAKIANDEMAEWVSKYPDRFVAALAHLPLNNMDAALKEIDRAIKDLKFKGIHINSPVNGKPLDSPEFLPMFEKMAEYDLPILIHPVQAGNVPDYAGETASKYYAYSTFGFVYQTTLAMTRIVFSGILQKYPNLKIVTHHVGAMVPSLVGRITFFYDQPGANLEFVKGQGLTKHPIEYFKMFYCDTAAYGYTPDLMCGYACFGADHMLFGTDFPYDDMGGDRITRETIQSIERMDISKAEKDKIFSENARRVFRLPT